MKNILKRAFDKHRGFAAGLALVVAGGLSGGCGTIMQATDMLLASGNPLMAGEKKLLKGIFGDQLDADAIRKHYYADECGGAFRNAYMVAINNNIAVCRMRALEGYSDDISEWLQASFVHEGVHVWQFQKLFSQTKGFCFPTGENLSQIYQIYQYVLGKPSFADYCHEQQAAIIEDYFLRFLLPHKRNYHWLKGGYDIENDAIIQKLVEDQFPQARITRLAVKAQRAALMAQNQAMAGPAP